MKLSTFCRRILEIVDNVPQARVNATAVGRESSTEWQLQVVIEPFDFSAGRHAYVSPTYNTSVQLTGETRPKQLKGR